MLTGKIHSTNILLANAGYAIYRLPEQETEAYAVLDVNIVNRTYTPAIVEMYILDEQGNNISLEAGVEIGGKGVFLRTAVTISAGDTLYVKSNIGSLSVVVYGGQFNYDLKADLPLPTLDPEDSLQGTVQNDQFGDTTYANESYYFIGSASGVQMFSAIDDSLMHTFTNPGDVNNDYGASIAASDFFVFIGAPDQTSGVTNGTGVVYIYNAVTFALVSTISNQQSQTNYGRFGTRLDANNSYFLISELNGGPTSATGAVHVYTTSNQLYARTVDGSTLSSVNDFGTDISLNDTFAVATSPSADSWVAFSAVTGSISGPYAFTNATSIDTNNNIVVVGDPNRTVSTITGAGAASLYDNQGVLIADLQSPVTLELNDNFGFDVAIGPNYVYVGAPGVDVTGTPDRGAVYSYTYTGNFAAQVGV